MKPIFQKFTIAATGDFGEDRNEKRIQQWVELRGGTYSRNVTKEVTHLICSNDQFKKKAAPVQEALQIKGLHIVNFDWLEDSLSKNTVRSVKPYLFQDNVVVSRSAKQKKKTVRERLREWKAGVQDFEKLMHCRTFHVLFLKLSNLCPEAYGIYRDSTGFAYDVLINRLDARTNTLESYRIKLFETHAEPHFYACYAVHNIPGVPRNVTQVLAPKSSLFELAIARFVGFFVEKTMVAWEERLDRIEASNPLAFEYMKPKLGPYGKLPGDEEEELLEKLKEESASREGRADEEAGPQNADGGRGDGEDTSKNNSHDGSVCVEEQSENGIMLEEGEIIETTENAE